MPVFLSRCCLTTARSRSRRRLCRITLRMRGLTCRSGAILSMRSTTRLSVLSGADALIQNAVAAAAAAAGLAPWEPLACWTGV